MAAPTPVITTLYETKEEIMVNVAIPDGGDSDVNAVTVIDISTYTSQATGTEANILEVWWSLSGFGAILEFDATSDTHGVSMAEGTGHLDFSKINGIPNTAGSGKTGDIVLTTNGITTLETAEGNQGSFVLRVSKEV